MPDRRSEGYGLNVPAIEALAAQGCGILLTVDCGISDVAAVARARELAGPDDMIFIGGSTYVVGEAL